MQIGPAGGERYSVAMALTKYTRPFSRVELIADSYSIGNWCFEAGSTAHFRHKPFVAGIHQLRRGERCLVDDRRELVKCFEATFDGYRSCGNPLMGTGIVEGITEIKG